MAGFCEHGDKSSAFVKYLKNPLVKLGDCRCLKKDSDPWS
jgi:hypothetical protein